MKPISQNHKEKARYNPPEVMPFAYCSACLDIVLDENEKASLLYDEIVKCYKLPGLIELSY